MIPSFVHILTSLPWHSVQPLWYICKAKYCGGLSLTVLRIARLAFYLNHPSYYILHTIDHLFSLYRASSNAFYNRDIAILEFLDFEKYIVHEKNIIKEIFEACCVRD